MKVIVDFRDATNTRVDLNGNGGVNNDDRLVFTHWPGERWNPLGYTFKVPETALNGTPFASPITQMLIEFNIANSAWMGVDQVSLLGVYAPYQPVVTQTKNTNDKIDAVITWKAKQDPAGAAAVDPALARQDVYLSDDINLPAGDPNLTFIGSATVSLTDPNSSYTPSSQLNKDGLYNMAVVSILDAGVPVPSVGAAIMNDPNVVGPIWAIETLPRDLPPVVDVVDLVGVGFGNALTYDAALPVVLNATVDDSTEADLDTYGWEIIGWPGADPNIVAAATLTDTTTDIYAPSATFDVDDTHSLYELGAWEIELTVTDTANPEVLTGSDWITVTITTDACAVAKLRPDYLTTVAKQGDIDQNCVVNLLDFALLAADWLDDVNQYTTYYIAN